MMLLRRQLPVASVSHRRESLVFPSLSHEAFLGNLPWQTPPSFYHSFLRVPSALRCEVYCMLGHLVSVILCKCSHPSL